MQKKAHKDAAQRLRTYQRQYDQLKRRIKKDVGFICEGTLATRRLPCGNPACGCHTDLRRRHGPYHQLSWKEHGKTASRYLSPEEIPVYQNCIDNRRRLAAIIKEMRRISQKALKLLIASEKRSKRRLRKKKETRKGP